LAAWHRLHQRIVDRVEHLEGGDGGLGLTRVEPAGRQGDVKRIGQLAFGRGGLGPGDRHDEGEDGEQRQRGRDRSRPPTHDEPPCRITQTSRVRPRNLLCALQASWGWAPPAEARLYSML